jgi:hypothetical protein
MEVSAYAETSGDLVEFFPLELLPTDRDAWPPELRHLKITSFYELERAPKFRAY